MALELDSVRAFQKVAEQGSFTRAAAQLGLSKSRVSMLVTELEREVGSRLVLRTTRTVQLTSEGEQFLARAEGLLHDADELSTMFSAPSTLKGRLRVDLPVALARDRIIPRLPEFFAAHPNLELQLSATDRRVDVLREGFDVVLRVGSLDDSSLQVKRLGVLPMMNCASAAYLVRYGVPKTLEDLDAHYVVHYASRLGTEPPAFEYRKGGKWFDKPMRALVTVNNTDAYRAACRAGLGIIQVPRLGTTDEEFREVLPDFTSQPLPVSLVHGYARSAPQRVRVFMAWLERVLRPHVTG
ncbi:MAG: LysR family transcriptional regulator [Archangium gephyra]|uniref:LysR family transcriptional regulator n=1 Tax=Archangium gephyra TaxID=48 RepID=A0A2W5THB7_9BACT|nr:MAG: LysR family transcriptional regulator [Archangium gephyra]